mgnify:CR=1 FL=1
MKNEQLEFFQQWQPSAAALARSMSGQKPSSAGRRNDY